MRFETELLSVFPHTPRLNLYVFTQAKFFIIKGQWKKFVCVFKYDIDLFSVKFVQNLSLIPALATRKLLMQY